MAKQFTIRLNRELATIYHSKIRKDDRVLANAMNQGQPIKTDDIMSILGEEKRSWYIILFN